MESAHLYQRGNYMRSDIKCKMWTEAQIQVLMDAFKQYGTDWRAISIKFFPDRNPNQLKCKYNYVMRTQKKVERLPLVPTSVCSSASMDSIVNTQHASWTSSYQADESYEHEPLMMMFDYDLFE
ncbi:Myb-like_DNA-binding domain-containing protein [Hexamita inflata]|uniref:Myb-like DNA-binding domain-containing protein n=1 Tax=Hexamita inflata TaxID=28002 RepID=A0AA86NSL9_9EUKA|nr:Myb-like DNA-binding domain-containing protein [Hexamita inflata]CAI9924099.1 Myb-like DNA-binding domain-containing protein [Hexamita inflata]